jgi:hypothetical protein
MMNQFPDHELTGFLMLRMGQVLQAQNRTEEAGEVFRVIESHFAFNHELRGQAKKMSQVLEL